MTGRPKVWTEDKLNQVKFLMKYNSMSEIGKLFDTTKNAVLGALYRDKVKNGYVPPPDSKYARIRKYHRRIFEVTEIKDWLSVYPMLMG